MKHTLPSFGIGLLSFLLSFSALANSETSVPSKIKGFVATLSQNEAIKFEIKSEIIRSKGELSLSDILQLSRHDDVDVTRTFTFRKPDSWSIDEIVRAGNQIITSRSLSNNLGESVSLETTVASRPPQKTLFGAITAKQAFSKLGTSPDMGLIVYEMYFRSGEFISSLNSAKFEELTVGLSTYYVYTYRESFSKVSSIFDAQSGRLIYRCTQPILDFDAISTYRGELADSFVASGMPPMDAAVASEGELATNVIDLLNITQKIADSSPKNILFEVFSFSNSDQLEMHEK